MPQWKRDRAKDIASRQDERWIAECPPEVRLELQRYDHHLVTVGSRRGVLVSYAGSAPDSAPSRIQVSFATDRGHPVIPAAAQALVNQLLFRPWDGASEDASEHEQH